jgi:antitoxin PrlF
MPKSTMTTKGQLTIPKQVREALMLDTGDEVEFTLTDDGAALMRPRHPSVGALFGAVQYDGPTVAVSAMDPGAPFDE